MLSLLFIRKKLWINYLGRLFQAFSLIGKWCEDSWKWHHYRGAGGTIFVYKNYKINEFLRIFENNIWILIFGFKLYCMLKLEPSEGWTWRIEDADVNVIHTVYGNYKITNKKWWPCIYCMYFRYCVIKAHACLGPKRALIWSWISIQILQKEYFL